MRKGSEKSSLQMAFLAQPDGLEEDGYARGFGSIAGLDEVGRGPWAGPVVAAAVILPRGLAHAEIKDSKLLTAKKREELAAWIKGRAVAWGLGVVESAEIDRINILNASLLAMSIAFKQLRPLPDYLLIDGLHKIPLEFLVEGSRQRFDRPERLTAEGQAIGNRQEGAGQSVLTPGFPQQRAIKKGDRLSISIAAASIVAKVARDQMMTEYDRLYPEYGFGRNKGYGSRAHLAALSRYGPLPIHRRSFRPVRESLKIALGGEAISRQLKF